MVIETRKDGTKFTNRALKDAAERQADVSTRYEQLQKDLVAQVYAVVYLDTHNYHCVMYCVLFTTSLPSAFCACIHLAEWTQQQPGPALRTTAPRRPKPAELL